MQNKAIKSASSWLVVGVEGGGLQMSRIYTLYAAKWKDRVFGLWQATLSTAAVDICTNTMLMYGTTGVTSKEFKRGDINRGIRNMG